MFARSVVDSGKLLRNMVGSSGLNVCISPRYNNVSGQINFTASLGPYACIHPRHFKWCQRVRHITIYRSKCIRMIPFCIFLSKWLKVFFLFFACTLEFPMSVRKWLKRALLFWMFYSPMVFDPFRFCLHLLSWFNYYDLYNVLCRYQFWAVNDESMSIHSFSVMEIPDVEAEKLLSPNDIIQHVCHMISRAAPIEWLARALP